MSSKIIPATLLCDFYKLGHRVQYPVGTEYVYSTWTPRTSRLPQAQYAIAFGFQAFIQRYLIDYFNQNFFGRSLADIQHEYKRVLKSCLGVENPDTSHIEYLHKLGYLPLLIKAVPEGTRMPLRFPMMTIENTDPKLFWLTNYIETLASCELWQASTSATIADAYRQLLDRWALRTVGNTDFVKFQGHDFSMRGMGGLESSCGSGAGHLLSFVGTDTVPAILYLENYYGANIERELVGTSINATEHSVMCAYSRENEFDCYKRLITEVYPKGFISIVSDTWDLWSVIDKIIKPLKDTIMAREGRVVIRPDSGDPVEIAPAVVQRLWDIFGGTTTKTGYKLLDPHIGCIYGDAITFDRADAICNKLATAGFASINMVLGIGSYTYQYNTRDTLGFALKSTSVTINGQEKAIYKQPITDDGTKNSARGRVAVQYLDEDPSILLMRDGLTAKEVLSNNLLRPIFKNGELLEKTSLDIIRRKLKLELTNA